MPHKRPKGKREKKGAHRAGCAADGGCSAQLSRHVGSLLLGHPQRLLLLQNLQGMAWPGLSPSPFPWAGGPSAAQRFTQYAGALGCGTWPKCDLGPNTADGLDPAPPQAPPTCSGHCVTSAAGSEGCSAQACRPAAGNAGMYPSSSAHPCPSGHTDMLCQAGPRTALPSSIQGHASCAGEGRASRVCQYTCEAYRIPALYIFHLHVHQALGQLPDLPFQACGLCDCSFTILQPLLRAGQDPQATIVSCTESRMRASPRARM